MTITITKKEFDSLVDIIDQVKTDYEAASDENYLSSMGEALQHADNVISKYKRARSKARTFHEARKDAANYLRGRGLAADRRIIDKLARRLIREFDL